MNKDNWELSFDGEVCLANDANDYFYEWIELQSDEGTLKDILEKYLGIKYQEKTIGIKVMEGAVFFYVKDSKADS